MSILSFMWFGWDLNPGPPVSFMVKLPLHYILVAETEVHLTHVTVWPQIKSFQKSEKNDL